VDEREGRLERLDDDLVLGGLGVGRDPPSRHDLEPVLRLDAQRAGDEHHHHALDAAPLREVLGVAGMGEPRLIENVLGDRVGPHRGRLAALEDLAVHPVERHAHVVRDAAMGERLVQRFVGVGQSRVLADDGDLQLGLRALDQLDELGPSGEVGRPRHVTQAQVAN